MKLTIHLAASAAGLALFAAALPGAVLAKPSVQTDGASSATRGPVVQTTAKDATKVQGWQTGAGEMSDEDCQGFADQIQEAIDSAIDDADSNDISGVLANLDLADSLDSLANEMGCAISYPAKAKVPGKSEPAPATAPGISIKVEGWQTGDGPLTEGDCEKLANNISQELDWASQDLESGDLDQMFYDLSRAEQMEDQALDGGCALSYPK